MGSKAPSVRSINVNQIILDDEHKLIDSVDVGIHLEYSGGFAIGIDVLLPYEKTAFLSAKGICLGIVLRNFHRRKVFVCSHLNISFVPPSTVARLEGILRLKFCRQPYSHWTIAFCPPPIFEVAISSRIQGQSYSVVTDLLASLVCRARCRAENSY